ncbi:MAG: CRISPR-associated protein Csn1, partial [Alistipes sp.]|nr:CRISPR-associated protein Csn1 [Alistipes sp.]
MSKILGLDLGTNSLGWAIAEQTDKGYALLDKGVDIFQEGVAREKNNEKPAVQDRTDARALRRNYFRRRLRKIEVLQVLIENDLCPRLTGEQLAEWRKRKVYPLDEAFIRWQRTDDNTDKNPYRDRYRALTERLDPDKEADRHSLGRAFYHLAQRRGFISNRKEAGKDSEDGQVKQSIKNLTSDMENAGCRYLGEYFYMLYQQKKKIRKKYTSRNDHYLSEFRAVCEKHPLPEALPQALHRAIFFHR